MNFIFTIGFIQYLLAVHLKYPGSNDPMVKINRLLFPS